MHSSKIPYPVNSSISTHGISAENFQHADLHYGHVIERVVRRDRMGISEVARKLSVSRRTLYNWFEMKKLELDVICKIGSVIGHDFSSEFPEEFANRSASAPAEAYQEAQNVTDQTHDAIYYWMDKYIKLLEKFNAILSSETEKAF